ERESNLEVSLLLARVGKDGDPTGELDVAVVSPPADPTEPCRIYDILGTQVNARVEAETKFRFGDDNSQPDSRVRAVRKPSRQSLTRNRSRSSSTPSSRSSRTALPPAPFNCAYLETRAFFGAWSRPSGSATAIRTWN